MKKFIFGLLTIVPFVMMCSDNHVTSKDAELLRLALMMRSFIIEKSGDGPHNLELKARAFLANNEIKTLKELNPINFARRIEYCRTKKYQDGSCKKTEQDIRSALD